MRGGAWPFFWNFSEPEGKAQRVKAGGNGKEHPGGKAPAIRSII